MTNFNPVLTDNVAAVAQSVQDDAAAPAENTAAAESVGRATPNCTVSSLPTTELRHQDVLYASADSEFIKHTILGCVYYNEKSVLELSIGYEFSLCYSLLLILFSLHTL